MKFSTLTNRRILFRCDGDQITGLGHLSRCISLARTLQLESPTITLKFLGRYSVFAQNLLARYNLSTLSPPIPEGSTHGVAAMREICAGFNILLLDSYALDQNFIDGLKHSQCRLALIDDDQRFDLSNTDLVLCFRAGSETLDYGASRQLLGPLYLPSKPEFQRIREQNLSLPVTRSIRHVLVFLSGMNADETLLSKVLNALAFPGIEVTYLADNKPHFGVPSNARHAPFTPDIESIYENTDFIICGGGLTKYESAYCGIANACLSLTPLQQEDTRNMAAENLTLDLGSATNMDVDRVQDLIGKFINSKSARVVQRKAFESKLDSNGIQRVAEALITL